jgi:prepilin-type N-terminal cleavage/methylation domain-containing protein
VFQSNQRGFTLIEVLIATALTAAVAIGVAQLLGIAVAAGYAARVQTSTAMLAAGKLEELRSLVWAYEPLVPGVLPRSDFATNLGIQPVSSSGPGLMPSPGGTLSSNLPPYVDYLDLQGQWVGGGSSPPPTAMFIRRWSIVPLPEASDRTLVLSVLVTTVAQELARKGPWTQASGQETLLVTLNTRKGR